MMIMMMIMMKSWTDQTTISWFVQIICRYLYIGTCIVDTGDYDDNDEVLDRPDYNFLIYSNHLQVSVHRYLYHWYWKWWLWRLWWWWWWCRWLADNSRESTSFLNCHLVLISFFVNFLNLIIYISQGQNKQPEAPSPFQQCVYKKVCLD